jgi:hypothetical protein
VLVLIVWIGVYPKAFTSKTEASVQALIAQVESKASVAQSKTAPNVAGAQRSQEPSRAGHPAAAQRSREPSGPGHPRNEPVSRLSLQ